MINYTHPRIADARAQLIAQINEQYDIIESTKQYADPAATARYYAAFNAAIEAKDRDALLALCESDDSMAVKHADAVRNVSMFLTTLYSELFFARVSPASPIGYTLVSPAGISPDTGVYAFYKAND